VGKKLVTVQFGIDWAKIEMEVNPLLRSGHDFHQAYKAVMGQYPAITGEVWCKGKSIVGTISQARKKKKKVPQKIGKTSAKKKSKPQGELNLS